MLLSGSLPCLRRSIMIPSVIRRCQTNVARSADTAAPKDYKVVLDNGTLYIDQDLAEALGWDSEQRNGVSLKLHGWAPTYFTITQTGSESGMSSILSQLMVRRPIATAETLAKRTAESGSDSGVQRVLEYLKDR